MNHRGWVLFGAALSIAASTDAYADSKSGGAGSENRAVAETLFFTARGLMEAGRYAEACVKLAESHRLDPAAGTLLNLAVCHEKEGRIASAWGEFRQALTEARKASRSDREELAKEHLAVLEPDLPMLTIEVPQRARVSGLEVARNGVPLNDAAWATELPVDPGTIEIVMRAPGYKPRTKTATIEKRQRMTIALEPLEIAPVPPAPIEFWTGRRKLGLVLAGVGAAAAGVGGYFGVSAIDDRSKSDTLCPTYDGERRCSSAGVDAMSRAQTSAIVSDVAFGVGALSLAAGVYFFVTGASHTEGARITDTKSSQNEGSPWTVRVSAGPSGAGGVVSRTF